MRDAVELRVHDPQAAREVRPGQFFQIGVDAPHTLLRRPYSAAWADPERGDLGFIFNVVGAGSAWLARLDDGDELDLLGPLGRGFDLDGDRPAICVAGGLGVAVFPGVVAALVARRRPVTAFLGARTAAHLLSSQRFAGAEVRIATDDGTAGYRGSVIDLLSKRPAPAGDDVFACGFESRCWLRREPSATASMRPWPIMRPWARSSPKGRRRKPGRAMARSGLPRRRPGC